MPNPKHVESDWVYQEEQDADYDGMEWFKDPPTRSQPPTPSMQQDPYIPAQDVVQENERFVFALKNAPNVLYTRYKQYGQLGVLGWSSEFSEMIDALRGLGFSGNMFVATRQQALVTCAEILKLPLEIKMQIIIMYLSSQVARLRRFLDGETNYNDYPQTDFPVETSKYTDWSSL